MKVMQRYRLELHWDKVAYREGAAILVGAYFSGPVLKEVQKLQPNDRLTLDMTEQHKVVLPEYYQAELSWQGVEHQESKILLAGAKIVGKYVNSIDTLKNTDWILIDCYKHDPKNHPYLLVYYAAVMKQEGEEKL